MQVCGNFQVLTERIEEVLKNNTLEFPLKEKENLNNEDHKATDRQNKTYYNIEELGEAKHIFSHVEWRMTGYLIHFNEIIKENNLTWVTRDEMREKYTLPSAYAAYIKKL